MPSTGRIGNAPAARERSRTTSGAVATGSTTKGSYTHEHMASHGPSARVRSNARTAPSAELTMKTLLRNSVHLSGTGAAWHRQVEGDRSACMASRTLRRSSEGSTCYLKERCKATCVNCEEVPSRADRRRMTPAHDGRCVKEVTGAANNHPIRAKRGYARGGEKQGWRHP